jgi:adenylate cyclase
VFDLQDQITDRVVGVVEPNLRQSEIEHSRRKRPESLDAYDLYLRALPHMASVMPADARIAAGFLADSLRLDPKFIRSRGNPRRGMALASRRSTGWNLPLRS